METQITQYDDFAVKHLAAFNAYKVIFTSQNPLPQLAKVSRDTVSLIIVTALAVVMIAAVIVSGSRTVDEFAPEGLPGIGIVAFVMVEGGIMAYAFFRARRSASKERLASTVRWATAGLILTVIVGLGANIDATLRSHNVFMPEIVRTTINLLVAISAPALGFISSDVLAIELMATDIKRRDAQRDYEAALADWQMRLNNSWRSKQTDWGVKVKVDVPALSNGISNGNEWNSPSKSSLGHKKVPDAMKRVEAYFAEFPDAVDGNPVEIAATLGVGKSTVYNYLKMHKGDNQS